MLMPISYQTDGNSEIPKKKGNQSPFHNIVEECSAGDAKLARTGSLLKTSLRTLPVAMQPKKSKQNSAQYYQNVMNMIHMTTYKTTNTSSRHNSRSIVTHHVIIFSEGTSCQCHHLFGAAEADFYQS